MQNKQPNTFIKYDVTVIGLGYVGLTLALTLAKAGFKVLGIEKQLEIVNRLKQSQVHFQEQGLQDILIQVMQQNNLQIQAELSTKATSDIYIITVGTPLDKNGTVILNYITDATKAIAANMADNALIIVRSTVKVGVCRQTVKPILASSAKKFQLAMCPERTLEGNAMAELATLPQIIGADDEATYNRAAKFFLRTTTNTVHMSSLEAAEIAKLVDNSYRDVLFGFANEIANICDAFKVNANEVIDGGKHMYPRTNVATPGLVGGPCLEKDPHILAQSAAEKGVDAKIVKSARLVNELQPKQTIDIIAKLLKPKAIPKITIWGIAFKGKPITDDVRGSMAIKVIEQLIITIPNATITLYDSVCCTDELQKINPKFIIKQDKMQAIKNVDCLIIANNHIEFSQTNINSISNELNKNGFIFDYWNHFKNNSFNTKNNCKYLALGNMNI